MRSEKMKNEKRSDGKREQEAEEVEERREVKSENRETDSENE